MKRRNFLEKAGLAALGGASLTGAEQAVGQPAAKVEQEPGKQPPRLLITSAETKFGQALAAGLASKWQVQLTGSAAVDTRFPFTMSPLGHDEATDRLVRGIGAIVHVGQPAGNPTEADAIDHRTRCTYNLLQAAAREGVRQVVYLSSLDVMTGYGDEFEITEDWRPLARVESGSLAHYLGEYVCREFAREQRLRVCVLRLGRVVDAETVADQKPDPRWVETRDAVQAVSLALAAGEASARLGWWSVFHIGSGSARGQFSIAKAARVLGYKPQFAWE